MRDCSPLGLNTPSFSRGKGLPRERDAPASRRDARGEGWAEERGDGGGIGSACTHPPSCGTGPPRERGRGGGGGRRIPEVASSLLRPYIGLCLSIESAVA